MYKKFFKRFIDIVISLICLPFILVLFIPISILIKVEDGGPVFYNSIRLGKNGIPFRMFKFRTMKINSPLIKMADGSAYNTKNDPRITRAGRFLRGSSIDELPQMLNILIGQMSLIGPRPDMFSETIYPENYQPVFSVRPGLTGYNQAYFRNQNNWADKLKKDLYYVENLSFFFDMKIICKTLFTVITRQKIYKQ